MKLAITLLLLLFSLQACLGENVNILWINDERNEVVTNAVLSAVQFVTRTPKLRLNLTTFDTSNVYNTKNARTRVCQTFGRMVDSNPPDLILDTSTSGPTSQVIKALAKMHQVPTVTLSYERKDENIDWSRLSADEAKYLIQIRPPGDIITGMIKQVVITRGITAVAIIHDDTIVLESQYFTLFSNLVVLNSIQRIKNDVSVGSQLKKFSEMNLKSVFVVGSAATTTLVMNVATSMNLSGVKFDWYAVTKDEIKSFPCSCSNSSVILMRPQHIGGQSTIDRMRLVTGVFGSPEIDLAFHFETTIRVARAVNTMKEAGVWPQNLTYSKCSDNNQNELQTANEKTPRVDLIKYIKKASSPSTFGSLVLSSNAGNMMRFSMEISELVYQKNQLLKISPIANWISDAPTSFAVRTNATFAKFEPKIPTYKIVAIIQPPFIYKTVDKQGKANYSGLCIDLINDLAKLMNFKYEIYDSPGNKPGFINKNLEWDGLVKELVDRNADIGLGAISVMAERQKFIDFTYPFYEEVGILILLLKTPNPPNIFTFMLVLDDIVWILIVLAYFITSTIIWYLDKKSPYSYQNNKEYYSDAVDKKVFTFKESLWFCITSLVPQGGGQGPLQVSGKIITLFWWTFVFIVIASYIANLAAILTVSRLQTTLESLKDLNKQYLTRYSPINGTAVANFFLRRTASEKRRHKIWQEWILDRKASNYEKSRIGAYEYPVDDNPSKVTTFMIETGFPNSLEQGIDWIKNPMYAEGNGKYALIADATDIRYTEMTTCEFRMIGKEFAKLPLALALPKGSPLRKDLNFNLLKIFNERKIDVLKNKWWEENPDKIVCPEIKGDDKDGGISIYNIAGLFIIALIGVICALIALGIEYLYYKDRIPTRTGQARNTSSISSKKRRKELELAKMNETTERSIF